MMPALHPSTAWIRGMPLAALLLSVAAPPAQAQEERIDSPYRWIPKGLRVGVTAGYLQTSRGSLRFGPGPTGFVTARLRARVSSPLSLELGAGAGSSDRFVIDPRLQTGPEIVDTLTSNWVSAHLGFQLALTGARTWHRVQPYLLFGGGLMSGIDEEGAETLSDSTLVDFEYKIGTAPLFHIGTGAELRPSDRIGLSFEVRDLLFRLKAPDGFFRSDVLDAIEEAGTPAPEGSAWTNNLELSVGLWYYF